MRRRFPSFVVLALLAVGCAGEPPAATPPAADPPSTAAPPPAGAGEAGAGTAPPPATETDPEPTADCSAAAVAEELPAQPELPAAVAAKREAIFAAATACDLAALDELAPPELRYTFGDHADPVAAWRAAEERGEPVLRWLAEVLRAAPGRQHGLWVWPAFFVRPVAEWTPEDRREAERLLGDDLERLTGSGAYLGYRVGIAADGTWQYFVAGD